jgi:uncharacterized protein
MDLKQHTTGTDGIAGLISRWTRFSFAHAGKLTLLWLLLGTAGLFVSKHLRIDPDLESLLPQSSRTILAMHETKKRFGSTDLFTISMVAEDPAEIARIQDRIRKQMETRWSDAVWVQTDRDRSFFRSHALFYLPVSQLQHLGERLKAKAESIRRGPLGTDLLSDSPSDTGPWIDATPAQLGLPDEAASEFRAALGSEAGPNSDSMDTKAGLPDSLRSRLIGRLRDGRYVGLVQAALRKPSSDIEYVKTVLERARLLLDPLRKQYGHRLEIELEGPYKELAEVEALARNGEIATLISILLTLGLVIGFFRKPGLILLVAVQALLSSGLTLGFTTLAYGRLNLYTMFVIAILFGMGTDFALYTLGYALRLVRKGLAWPEAMARTLMDLSSSLIAASVTTIAGLLVLLTSQFAGFHEFGVIASVGIFLSFALTFLFLPAALFLYLRLATLVPGIGWLQLEPTRVAPVERTEPTWILRVSRWSALVAIGGAVLLTPFASGLAFEYDFEHLRDQHSNGPSLPIQEALGNNRTSSQPVILLTRDSATMDALHDSLAMRLADGKDTLLRGFLTLRSFVPRPERQLENLGEFARLDSLLSDPVFSKASGQDSVSIAMLREMVKARPFGSEALPPWALNLLRERDGSVGRIGFVHGRFNSADARDAQLFESHYGTLQVPGKEVWSFSSSFVYADVVRMVREDSLRMSLLMLAALVILMAILLRRIRPLLVSLVGMIVSLAWCLGLMGLFGVKVNVFNLIVITTLQAGLTDVVIYLVLAWERQGRQGVARLYTDIGVLMAVAIGTTITGYAGMLFTTHMGIRSIGSFAVLGLSCCLLASLAVTPWLCQMLLPPETRT